MNRIRYVVLFALTMLSIAGGSSTRAAAGPGVLDRLLYFDEPVGFTKLYPIAVYRGWTDKNTFYMLPTAVGDVPADTISIQYQATKNGLTGIALFSVAPAFDSKVLDEVMKDLRSSYPGARFVVAEPTYSEFEVVGFEVREIATPVLASNPLLSSTSISIKLNDRALHALLQEGTHTAGIFGIRHRFAIKGVELDDDFQPRLATRWFNRGASFAGSCSLKPERYINVETGRRGCVFKVMNAASDVKEIQALLNKLGLYAGKIDGVLGFRTREAIKRFEETQGSIADGLLTSDLVERARSAVKAKESS